MADDNRSGTLPINVTFTASVDTQNPLTTHVWKVDGVVQTGQTTGTFTKTFTAYRDSANPYVIEHSGSNSCGSNCATTRTLSITPSPEIQSLVPPALTVVGVMTVGMIGMSWIGNTLKPK